MMNSINPRLSETGSEREHSMYHDEEYSRASSEFNQTTPYHEVRSSSSLVDSRKSMVSRLSETRKSIVARIGTVLSSLTPVTVTRQSDVVGGVLGWKKLAKRFKSERDTGKGRGRDPVCDILGNQLPFVVKDVAKCKVIINEAGLTNLIDPMLKLRASGGETTFFALYKRQRCITVLIFVSIVFFVMERIYLWSDYDLGQEDCRVAAVLVGSSSTRCIDQHSVDCEFISIVPVSQSIVSDYFFYSYKEQAFKLLDSAAMSNASKIDYQVYYQNFDGRGDLYTRKSDPETWNWDENREDDHTYQITSSATLPRGEHTWRDSNRRSDDGKLSINLNCCSGLTQEDSPQRNFGTDEESSRICYDYYVWNISIIFSILVLMTTFSYVAYIRAWLVSGSSGSLERIVSGRINGKTTTNRLHQECSNRIDNSWHTLRFALLILYTPRYNDTVLALVVNFTLLLFVADLGERVIFFYLRPYITALNNEIKEFDDLIEEEFTDVYDLLKPSQQGEVPTLELEVSIMRCAYELNSDGSVGEFVGPYFVGGDINPIGGNVRSSALNSNWKICKREFTRRHDYFKCCGCQSEYAYEQGRLHDHPLVITVPTKSEISFTLCKACAKEIKSMIHSGCLGSFISSSGYTVESYVLNLVNEGRLAPFSRTTSKEHSAFLAAKKKKPEHVYVFC